MDPGRGMEETVFTAPELKLPHGSLRLPAFFPDGTYGTVRCVDACDLISCRVPGIVMNSFHLMSRPGLGVVRAVGGLHAFAGWDLPILTDSGGFQVFSLLRENPKYGEVRKNGAIFRREDGRKVVLSPEKSMQMQFACGADIMMCLDYCTHPEDSREIHVLSVERTVEWAARCKEEFVRQLRTRRMASESRPLLFAVIQGGNDRDLRERCAARLREIGFDGYGYGGWPADSEGRLAEENLRLTAELMPEEMPKYAMGIGKPEGIVACYRMGYNLFDCVIPTREARHNRLYVLDGSGGDAQTGYSYYYILDEQHIRDSRPVSELCDCLLCRKYSRAYLYHLKKTDDPLGLRLATMHNLRFYTRLLERVTSDGA